MIPVSVIILTRNEAANLDRCLTSVHAFDDIFVVDSGSTDATVAIARTHGARIVEFAWNGRYPKKKQWSLDNLPLRHDWVLLLDADERPGPELVIEIARLLEDGPAHAGYFLRGQPVFLGRRLRFGRGYRKLSLFDRRRARFPVINDLDVERMWEVEGHYQPMIEGSIGHLRHAYLHDDGKPLYHWFERHNRYSDWEAARSVRAESARMTAAEPWSRRILKYAFAHLPCRPLVVFAYEYLLRLGCLDGRAGLHLAVARAFYYWQIDVKRINRPRHPADRRPEP